MASSLAPHFAYILPSKTQVQFPHRHHILSPNFMMWAGTSLPHSNADGWELGTLSIRDVHVSDIAKAPFLLIAFGETIKKTSSLLQVNRISMLTYRLQD